MSCAPVVLVSFDMVGLARRIDAVLVPGVDVVPLRTVLVECSTEAW